VAGYNSASLHVSYIGGIDSRGITPLDHAPAGGGFPIHLAGTGIVGAVTVSGVPSVATWTGRDGTKQSTPEVEAGSWSWVGPKQEDRGRDDRGQDDRGGRARADEIPF
jgi:hypothetical protein